MSTSRSRFGRLAFVALLALSACTAVRPPGLGAAMVELPAGAPPTQITASSDEDVWLSAFVDEKKPSSVDAERILHWTGNGWNADDTLGPFRVQSASPVGASDLWFSGDVADPALIHWTQGNVEFVSVDEPFEVMLFPTLRPDNVWGVGDHNFWHFDGASWSAVPNPRPISTPVDVPFMQFPIGINAGAVGLSTLRFQPNPAGSSVDGVTTLMSYDGAQWTEVSTPENACSYLLWMPSPDQPWIAVADSPTKLRKVARRESDGSWTQFALDGFIRALGGRSPSDGFAIVDHASDGGSRLYHFDGSSWTAVDSTSLHYSAMAVAPTTVWIAAHDDDGHAYSVRYPL
jgi:hypothetical protein